MSEPTSLPRKADIPAQRLSRPERKLSPKVTSLLPQAERGKSGDGSGGSIPSPATAVTRDAIISPTNTSLLHDLPSPSGLFSTDGTGDDLAISPTRVGGTAAAENGFKSKTLGVHIEQLENDHHEDGDDDTPRRRGFRYKFNKSRSSNFYEMSTWNKFTTFFTTSVYATKVFLYQTIMFIWNLPDHIVRWWIIPRPPKRKRLPTPATQTPKPKKDGLVRIFSEAPLQLGGAAITLALNGAFAYWVWVTVDVWIHPHQWRLRPRVTATLNTWTSFNSVEIWAGIMLGIWNMLGTTLVAILIVVFIGGIRKIYCKIFKIPPKSDEQNPKNSKLVKNLGATAISLGFIILVVWPVLACTVTPPRMRVSAYKSTCSSGWDYRAILDGRVDAANLTKGSVNIWDLETNQVVAAFQTEDYVNTTWFRTEEHVLLGRLGEPPTDKEYVSLIQYNFPYLWTSWEQAGWVSLPGIQRETGGNYTATLVNPIANSTRSITGVFPYLDDDFKGLRLDSVGLIPDIPRSWRTVATSVDNCGWGPDARLLENTDVTARYMAGDGHVVLQTDMTKFGRCSELTVCANRRKQVIDGLGYAEGEAGVKLLDELLIVPLGLLLVEQIRFGSCCGDGFSPYTDTN
ncbi:hypothetical protein TWF694_010969 [Orbilia ellipsospora]|uniref:Uncharacterized protein n=1 Tax=Orbilia ellipsospora TaxID=2528407 RepID=A0AAV9X8K6_9PEZI